MAHRERRTAQDPDVEASQAELAAIEAQKNTAQNAVLSVAQNKKQVEADFEAAKEKLVEELTAKRSEVVTEMKKLDESLSDKKMKVEATEEVFKKVTEETKQLIVARDAIQKEVTEANEKRSAANTEVTRLMVLQHNLNDSIKDSRTDYKEAEEKVAAKTKELADISRKVTELTKEYADLSGNVAAYHTDINKFDEIKQKYLADHKQLEVDLQDKTQKKTALDAELLKTQKKIADHKQEMAIRDAESSTRAGNASRLEQHVNTKLEHLKVLEAQFTNEHLARVGYKKTE